MYYNPVALAVLNPTEARTLRALGSLEATVRLADRLRLNGRLGFDVLDLRERQWQSPRVEGTYPESAEGVAKSGYSAGNRYVGEGFVEWTPALPAGHNLGLTAGASAELNDWELNFIRGEGFSNEKSNQVRNAARITEYDGTLGEHNLLSVFSRINYSLADRYFFTASLRADGSSRFGPKQRWGFFPAVSAGWLMSAEPFMANAGPLSTVRWRASWGETGNEEIGDYAYQGLFGEANYGGTPGIAPSSLSNPDLRWETTREWNLGADIGLFRDRVILGVDRYRKHTVDLLLNRPITSTSGFTSVLANVGEMVNEGWEIRLATQNVLPARPGGLRWVTEVHIATNRNEVTRLFNNEQFNTGERGVNRVQVGEPLGAFHMLRFEGVDPATGNAIYFDANGDGSITSDDRVIVGSPHPDYCGGITNELALGPFDLRMFVTFSRGAKIFNAMRLFADDGGYALDNKFRDVLRRWCQPGDVTDVPRASYYGESGATEISSRFLEDGSYVRIQEVTLGVQLPAAWVRPVGLSGLRLFASARNLFTFTDYSGYSPDVNSNGASATASLGTDFYAYLLARTITLGFSGSL